MAPTLFIGNKNYSSWSLRAWLLMAEAGIEFEERRIPLDTPTFDEEIARISPARRVPVLALDDVTVWDSLAIAETVAERWPDRQLWPADAAARAHARAISAEMHSGFGVLRDTLPMNCRAMGRKVAANAALDADIRRIFDIWADCGERYGGDGWLFGSFTVADAMYAPVALRFRTYGIRTPESADRFPARLLRSEALQDWLLAAESETEVIDADEKGH